MHTPCTQSIISCRMHRLRAQATVVELLEAGGLPAPAVSMVLAEDGGRRLGDVLAQAVMVRFCQFLSVLLVVCGYVGYAHAVVTECSIGCSMECGTSPGVWLDAVTGFRIL